MTVKTSLSDSDFIKILYDYDLGQYCGSEPIVKGSVQTNYIVRTSGGKYIFRYYENRSKESASFETNLIRYLKRKNYPCPEPIANLHGRCIGTHEGKPFCFFEFFEAKDVENPSEEQSKQLIRKAAELQDITKKYRPSNKNYRWNYSPELCKQLAEEKAEKLNTLTAKKKLTWIQAELAKLILPKPLPKGICHCDFHYSNVLFDNDQFKALIDFDDANYTYLVFDLVGLVESNAWPHKKDEVLDFDQARKTVDEYSRYRPLTRVEKRHLFDVYKLSILFDSIWFMDRGNAQNCRERRKIDFLNRIGAAQFYANIFQ